MALVLIASRGSWFYLDEWDSATRDAAVVLLYRAMFELRARPLGIGTPG